MRKSLVLGVAAIALVSVLATACGRSKQSAASSDGAGANAGDKQEIRFGALVPSTGPNAEWGKKNTIALKILEENVNKAGGINGRPVKIIVYDTNQKPDQAANLVRKLAQDDKVLAIAGPLTSGECEVAFPVANQMEISIMSQASSKPGVSKANRPWAFRNTMTEDKLATVTMPIWVKHFNPKKVAVIYDAKDATSSTLGKSVLPSAAKHAGLQVVNENDPITFQSGDTDVSPQVTKLKNLQVDGLLLGADFGPASNILREMNRQGVKIPVIGGTPLISSTILQAHGEIPIVAPATFYPQNPAEGTQKFVKEFLARATDIPEATREPNMYDATIVDNIGIFIEAFKQSGASGQPGDLKSDRVKIRDYVAKLKDYKGIAGSISMDPDGDGIKQAYLLLAQQGKWVEIKR